MPMLRRSLIGGTIVFTVGFAGAGLWIVHERMTAMTSVSRKPPAEKGSAASAPVEPRPSATRTAAAGAAQQPAAPPSGPALTREQTQERQGCIAANSDAGLEQAALMLVAAACHQIAREAEIDKARCVLGMRSSVKTMGPDLVLKSCQADWRFRPASELPIPAVAAPAK